MKTKKVKKDQGYENPPQGFSPDSTTKVYSVGEIVNRMEDGRLKLPDFQRKYIWSNKVKQAFILSLFLGFPVIGVTFTIDPNGTSDRYIVDGYQRLSTIRDFIAGKISVNFTEGKNTKFEDLTEIDQRAFKDKEVTINEIKIERKYWPFLFRNINRGGVVLNDHELRRAMPWGKNYEQHEAIIMLDDFADLHTQWLALFGKNSRYRGFNGILRAVALHQGYPEYQKPLSQFLDAFCSNLDTFIPDPDALQDKLNLIVEALYTITGKNSFRMGSGKPVNAGMVDMMLHAGLLCLEKNPRLTVSQLGATLDAIRKDLLTNEVIKNALQFDTSGRESVVSRMSTASEIVSNHLEKSLTKVK